MGNIAQIKGGAEELPAKLEALQNGRWRLTRRIPFSNPSNVGDAMFGTLGEALELEYQTQEDETKFKDLRLVAQSEESDVVNRASAMVLTKVYETLTDIPVQLGDARVEDIEGAFVGTHATTFVYVNGTTRPARSFTYRYIVKGDGTAISAQWLASNEQLAAEGGLPVRYYITGRIVQQGNASSIIERTYFEKPDTFAFPRGDTYFFEGKIGAAGNIVVQTQDPQTKFTTFEIRESYHIGPVDPDALTWEVEQWAAGSLAYRPANNNGAGVDGYFPFNFSGCIGTVTIAQTNGYFNGIKVTNVTGTVSSEPDTYPTGQQLIDSKPVRWAGQMWKKTNKYVTYP